MDSTDLKIINILTEDGRISNAHIARELELSEGTIRRRIRNLIDTKTINIVAVSDPKKLGYSSEALIGIQCEPNEFGEVSKKIASLKQTKWVISTTGSYDVFCLVAVENPEQLGEFIRVGIGSIQGIIRTETFVNLSVSKREYGLF
ncbi:MAG: hypothetical protein CL775_01350 [Chloroflexi bacterium]|nr:hypothetical protein [Chloroflexota bacterium]|tara:strand:- start:1451 stop:1888 length:438 start_codon:yes stop_codon:yes gene_type:complete